MGPVRNVVVVGGSYVGFSAARELAKSLPATHRVLLVEPHTHFHHLFAFPRYAIVPNSEHKAFIPYSHIFSTAPNPSQHAVVAARAISLHTSRLTLDREWQGSKDLPFDYLVAATGTRLSPPATVPADDKPGGINFLQGYQNGLRDAKSVVIIGGGAVGVQMACDLKETYPTKEVTLVHSRDTLMPVFHEALSGLIKARFEELGVKLVTGTRAVVPADGFPTSGDTFTISLKDGRSISANFAVLATGQIANSDFVRGLLPEEESSSLFNAASGFIRIRPTLQFADPRFPHMFAIGDVADSGVQKAARPGVMTANIAVRNILALIDGRAPTESFEIPPAGIHMTLGLSQHVIFVNPDTAKGQRNPTIKEMKIEDDSDSHLTGMWKRLGVVVESPEDFSA